MTETITFDQFAAVDVRAGEIVQVEAFPEARKPAWKLVIDLGPEIGVNVNRHGVSAPISTIAC
ncbi:tRNA-binding protein [Azospirillum oryzae]|uniref:tRNA-binding protein n=1 Tax=Azospirillum oryzae TaxID=286727 RepID=A0A1X7GKW8_9PROT|nr:hypothetical protein [Azospirillum oryzae]SMF70842.1 tRNA-binding protein [Azospirillum oryzae]